MHKVVGSHATARRACRGHDPQRGACRGRLVRLVALPRPRCAPEPNGSSNEGADRQGEVLMDIYQADPSEASDLLGKSLDKGVAGAPLPSDRLEVDASGQAPVTQGQGDGAASPSGDGSAVDGEADAAASIKMLLDSGGEGDGEGDGEGQQQEQASREVEPPLPRAHWQRLLGDPSVTATLLEVLRAQAPRAPGDAPSTAPAAPPAPPTSTYAAAAGTPSLVASSTGAGGVPLTSSASPAAAAAAAASAATPGASRKAVCFCKNCGAPSPGGVCEYCGHSRANDAALTDARTPAKGWRQWRSRGRSTASRPQSSASSSGQPAPQVAVVYDERMLLHMNRLAPPLLERPDRLRAIAAHLERSGILDEVQVVGGREATPEELCAVHDAGLLAAVKALSTLELANGAGDELARLQRHYGDGARLGNQHTYDAALLAAGCAVEATLRTLRGDVRGAFALVRPGGGNASRDRTGGACYFNNVAVAAAAARAQGAARVMVLDWGVHHCDGTQSIFEDDPSVLVVSLHKYLSGFYSGTGFASDIGTGGGKGHTVNVAFSAPLVRDPQGSLVPLGSSAVANGDVLAAMTSVVLPLAYEFAPDIILVAAGFDAARLDVVGQCRVSPECYAHMTSLLQGVAPLVLILEGGYNLEMTAQSVELCLGSLLGRVPPPLPSTSIASALGWTSILHTMSQHQTRWQSMGLYRWMQLMDQASALGPPSSESDDEAVPTANSNTAG